MMNRNTGRRTIRRLSTFIPVKKTASAINRLTMLCGEECQVLMPGLPEGSWGPEPDLGRLAHSSAISLPASWAI